MYAHKHPCTHVHVKERDRMRKTKRGREMAEKQKSSRNRLLVKYSVIRKMPTQILPS